tara:strand:- start:113 stop:364 length:252 start_codon:yes stop_codon:yes gene_type:complete
MSFFATGKDYKKQNLKTRPTKGIPKFRKKRKAPKCGQCEKESVKVVMLGADKRYLCQFHVIAYEKKDYKVEKSYNHFKKASEI